MQSTNPTNIPFLYPTMCPTINPSNSPCRVVVVLVLSLNDVYTRDVYPITPLFMPFRTLLCVKTCPDSSLQK